MNAGEVLRASERAALRKNVDGRIISHVTGKKTNKQKKSLGAVGFITAMIVVFMAFFGTGNMIPSAISERLIEEMDVQYADAVESKKLVFQQALSSGEIPEDTANLLKANGVLVGYLKDGEFVEGNKADGELVLKKNEEIIKASEFFDKVSSDVGLYNAFNNATYSRAAYYYDDAATKVFKKIGTNRNNYTGDSDFDEVMDKMVGEGSSMEANGVMLVEKTRELNDGTTETYYEYDVIGEAAKSKDVEVDTFINTVGEKNKDKTTEQATVNAADELKVMDTVAKEQKSSLFFLTFMENISKMKAGEGSEAKINEAMNYLYESKKSEVVDIKTGEVVTTEGTALESKSLYAVLAGKKVSAEEVENYSSDRIIKTVNNQLGNNTTAETDEALNNTVASTGSKLKSAIGRFIEKGIASISQEVLAKVKPTVSSSLIDNSFDSINGVTAGEMLVEGAMNFGKELAKASGATPGDEAAITAYLKLNSEILAMDAATERMNRSPFDITSRHTFLGSIIYKMAISNIKVKTASILSTTSRSISSVVASSVQDLLPHSYADETEGYLATFGDCVTQKRIGAVGSAQCSEIATFDASTLNDTFNNAEFKAFVEKNTELNSSGTRKIKKGSILERFVLYNNERTTPVGVMDGGILNSLINNSSSNTFFSDILAMIKNFLGASEEQKRIASGAAFVNSSSNQDWDTYKYAQRYVSLARATDSLRRYAGDSTAYNNILYFEGSENPVIALLKEYYAYNR